MPGNSFVGGTAYGSIYKPEDSGSRGGGTHGGLGGGKVYIKSPAIMLMDGLILADGAAGSANSGGGGSGGAIFLEVGKFLNAPTKGFEVYKAVTLLLLHTMLGTMVIQ